MGDYGKRPSSEVSICAQQFRRGRANLVMSEKQGLPPSVAAYLLSRPGGGNHALDRGWLHRNRVRIRRIAADLAAGGLGDIR
jgi:hypothetical protein